MNSDFPTPATPISSTLTCTGKRRKVGWSNWWRSRRCLVAGEGVQRGHADLDLHRRGAGEWGKREQPTRFHTDMHTDTTHYTKQATGRELSSGRPRVLGSS
eukprot:350095-Chlamydomonas_euryale.AAC.1